MLPSVAAVLRLMWAKQVVLAMLALESIHNLDHWLCGGSIRWQLNCRIIIYEWESFNILVHLLAELKLVCFLRK
jgi:hypothetical protein